MTSKDVAESAESALLQRLPPRLETLAGARPGGPVDARLAVESELPPRRRLEPPSETEDADCPASLGSAGCDSAEDSRSVMVLAGLLPAIAAPPVPGSVRRVGGPLRPDLRSRLRPRSVTGRVRRASGKILWPACVGGLALTFGPGPARPGRSVASEQRPRSRHCPDLPFKSWPRRRPAAAPGLAPEAHRADLAERWSGLAASRDRSVRS